MVINIKSKNIKQETNMYINRKIILFLITVLITTVMFSQNRSQTNDTINTEVVNVVKPYTPKISDAFKLKEIPSIDDEETATKKEIKPSDFQDKKIREVISKIFDLCEQGIEINSAVLINSFKDQEMQNMISRLMANDATTVGDKRKMHSDYMNRMKKDRKKLRMKILQEQIGEAERDGDQSKLDALLKEYNHLIKEVIL